MKEVLFAIFLSSVFCNTGFAESYYFKGCKISNAVTGNYIINLEKNIIEVELKMIDGTVQHFLVSHEVAKLTPVSPWLDKRTKRGDLGGRN